MQRRRLLDCPVRGAAAALAASERLEQRLAAAQQQLQVLLLAQLVQQGSVDLQLLPQGRRCSWAESVQPTAPQRLSERSQKQLRRPLQQLLQRRLELPARAAAAMAAQ